METRKRKNKELSEEQMRRFRRQQANQRMYIMLLRVCFCQINRC